MLFTLAAAAAVLLVYFGVSWIAGRLGGHPLANPVLWSALILLGLLFAAGIEVGDFVNVSRPLLNVLDLAVTALAYPLVAQLHGKGRDLFPVVAALLAGGIAAMGVAIGLAILLGLPLPVVQALSVKSISSGFAIALMERFGGPAPLAAGLVVTTGMIGALLLPPLLRRAGFTSAGELGLATGQAAHIVGTDALLRTRPEAGAYAALAMSVSGLIGALLLPLFWPIIAG